MKILITGGAGFIGSHLTDYLVEKGHKITILDDLSTGSKENIAHHGDIVDFVENTIMNEDRVDFLVSRSDQIYHLAAAVGVKKIVEEPLASMKTNIRGTEIVLDAASKHHKKILIASTSEVYGKNRALPFKEDDDSVFGSSAIARWSYGSGKKIDEFYALACNEKNNLPVVITRFFNTCGPRQTGRYGMVIPTFVQQAIKDEPITVYGSGEQSRCFGYVGDVVDGIVTLMETPEAIGEIFNVGSEERISINNLAKKIKELTDSNSEIVHIPYEEAYEKNFEDMEHRIPSLSKIRKCIGYSPKTDLEGLLRKTIEYYKK